MIPSGERESIPSPLKIINIIYVNPENTGKIFCVVNGCGLCPQEGIVFNETTTRIIIKLLWIYYIFTTTVFIYDFPHVLVSQAVRLLVYDYDAWNVWRKL